MGKEKQSGREGGAAHVRVQGVETAKAAAVQNRGILGHADSEGIYGCRWKGDAGSDMF